MSTQVGQTLAYPLNLVPLGPMKFIEVLLHRPNERRSEPHQSNVVRQRGMSANQSQERPGFQIFSLLKNPMVLMIGVTLLMTVLLPKLMSTPLLRVVCHVSCVANTLMMVGAQRRTR